MSREEALVFTHGLGKPETFLSWLRLVVSSLLLCCVLSLEAAAQSPLGEQEQDPVTVLLDSPSPAQRRGVLEALAAGSLEVSSGSKTELAQALCLYLEEEDTDLRALATAAVRRLGVRVPTLEAALWVGVECDDASVRAESAVALGGISKPWNAHRLAKLLADRDSRVRHGAARGIAGMLSRARRPSRLWYASGTFRLLKPLLSDGRVEVRRSAIRVLELLPAKYAAEFEAEIGMLLTDASPTIRSRGLRLSRVIDWGSRYRSPIGRAVVALVEDPVPSVRRVAAREVALGLTRRFSDCTPERRSKYCGVCSGRVPNLELGVPLLVSEALDSPDHEVRREVHKTLRHLGPVAASAVPAISKRARERDSGEELSALVLTLAAIRGPEEVVIPFLRGLLIDANSSLESRRAAANALADFPCSGDANLVALRVEEPIEIPLRVMLVRAQARAGVGALPDLELAAQDARVEVRVAVSESGPLLGQEAVELLGRLAAEDEDPEVRAAAVRGLGRLVDSPAATERLFHSLKADPHEDVRDAAARVLADHARASRSVVPRLARVLEEDSDVVTRMTAVRALVKVGGRRVEPAYPSLVRATVARDEEVRICARWGLGYLGKERASKKLPVLAWVIPEGYRYLILAFGLALLTWCGLARRFPRHAPKARWLRLLHFALVVAPPALLASWAVRLALEPGWTRFFVPKESMTLLDVPTAAGLTAAAMAALPAAWAALRGSNVGEELGDVPALEQEAAARAAATPSEGDSPRPAEE